MRATPEGDRLRAEFDALDAEIGAMSTGPERDAAMQRAGELAEAIVQADKLEIDPRVYSRNWYV